AADAGRDGPRIPDARRRIDGGRHGARARTAVEHRGHLSRLHHGAKSVKTKSRPLAGAWHEKHVLCTASSSGLPSVNCANPQPPVSAYFFESFTMNCTFVGGPATEDAAKSFSI